MPSGHDSDRKHPSSRRFAYIPSEREMVIKIGEESPGKTEEYKLD